VIYNPIALDRAISYAFSGSKPSDFSTVQNNDIFHNYDFHSTFSSLYADELARQISTAISTVHEHLMRADHIFITYGTAWSYVLKSHQHIVANCHKMPSGLFEKRLLSVEEIMNSFRNLYSGLKKIRPDLHIILTVSPVRHAKDTLPLNAVSKSTLRIACHYLAEELPDVEYFPASEIMLDDLRDYRFYKSDMIHPTEQAEEYIWNVFTDKHITLQGQEFIRQWQGIRTALLHKPFHPGSSGHKNFLNELLAKLEGIKSIVKIDDEIKAIKAQIEDHSTREHHDH